MIKFFLSRYTSIQFIFLILLLSGCKKDSENQPSNQYIGTYTGTADSFMDGDFLAAQNNIFIQFEKGANSNELRIIFSNLDIKQDKVTLSGNKITLPKKAILSDITYEEGNGTFNGNKLTFNYIISSEMTMNGQTTKSEIKTVCNLTKI